MILFPVGFWKSGLPPPPGPPVPPSDELVVWAQADQLGLTVDSLLALLTDLAEGYDFVQSDSAKQPMWLATGGPNGRPCVQSDGVASTMLAPPNPDLELPTEDFTFICVCKTQAGHDNFVYAHDQFDLGYCQRIYSNGHTSFYQRADIPATIGWTDAGSINISDGNWHVLVARRSGGVLTLMVDGVADTTVPTNYRVSFFDGTLPWIPAQNGPVSSRGMELFTFNLGNFSACALYSLVGYRKQLAPDVLRTLSQEYADYCGITMAGDIADYILFDGNSLVYGQGSTAPSPPNPDDATGNDMPSQVIRLFGGIEILSYQNGGVNGYTTADIKNQLQGRLALFLNHGGAKRAYFVSEGINDMATAGLTPAQAVDSLKDLCTKVKAMLPGTPIVVATITPWSSPGSPYTPTPEDMESARQAYNQLIRDEPLGTYWDGVADVGANALIGVPGANLNETYYTTDHTHMINAGFSVFAGVVYPVLNNLLNAE